MIYPYRPKIYSTSGFTSVRKPPAFLDCIVPQEEWTGDTGIPELVAEFRADPANMPAAEYRPPEMIARKIALRDTSTHKVCRLCKRLLPRSEFHKCKKSYDGLNFRCKECTNQAQKEIRQQKNALPGSKPISPTTGASTQPATCSTGTTS